MAPGVNARGPSRRWLRIIPIALIMYTISFVNRTSISLALPSLSRDLHLLPQQAGMVAGIFFWGYLALQIPGGHLAEHWSAKKWIAICLVAWGLCAAACGIVRSYHELLLFRLLLGVAESGVWPATLVLLSHWFSRAERARANAFWMLCLPGAVVFSSPVAGWMLDRWNWRVMFIATGALPFIWLPIWLLFIRDYPAQASWLPAGERASVTATLRQESEQLEEGNKIPYLRALLRPQTFLLTAVYFCFVGGQMGMLFWLPTAMEKLRKLNSLTTGILYVLPFLFGALCLVLISRHSDKVRERRLHVAGSMMIGGTCLLLAVATISYSLLLAFVFIILSGFSAFGPMGAFWAIPTETLPSRVAGSVMGLVNAFGNLGGFFAPLAVGYLNAKTGNFLAGFAYLGALTVLGGALALFLRTAPDLPRLQAKEVKS
ncbi:MAG TPA: MFS transporter [Candidatus Dormibacteraeota bacterium]|nr:MFS transporter [Candidatus Dormibacteraeota bacterium]